MFSASQHVADTHENTQDSRITTLEASLVPHAFRGVFADGVHYLYADDHVDIGYQASGNSVVLIYRVKQTTNGGHTSVEKEREQGKINIQIWDGTAQQPTATLLMFGSNAAPTSIPEIAPQTVINKTQVGQVFAILGLGPTLDRYYEVRLIVHQAGGSTTYGYLLQVYKRH